MKKLKSIYAVFAALVVSGDENSKRSVSNVKLVSVS